jgi:hypothetical protein
MTTKPHTSQTPTEQLISAIEEQTGWLRALALPQARTTIEHTLTKTVMRKAYEASDGKTTVREVADAAGISKSAVANWWARWCAVGIGIELDGGRVKHLISLKDLGLPTDVKDD